MRNEKQINLWKSGIIQTIKWTSMCFVCLMTFSLGIFLGKQWSDTDPQSVNISSELDSNTKKVQPDQKQVKDTHSEVQDIHSEKKPPQEVHSQTNTTTTTNPSQRKPSSDTEEVQKHQDKKIPEKNELESSETPQMESSSYNNLPLKVKKTLSAKYTIQLRTYKKEDQAISYLKNLKDQGIDAFYMSFTDDNDQTWYRVSSGVYSDKTLANNELQRILKTTSVEDASIKEIF